MFEKGINIVEQFTRPVFAISRNFGSNIIKQESATIFFVNELGFAITTGDILQRYIPKNSYYDKYENFKKDILLPENNIDKLILDYGYNSSDAIIELKTIFLNCGNVINKVSSFLHPYYNIGLLHFEDISEFTYNGYARFINSLEYSNKGKELMRLGFPFPQSINYLYNNSIDQIEWDMSTQFIVDSFPLKGIITRQLYNANHLIEVEMSTPGYKGHEGSPLFDERGNIHGMHCTNFNLGLDNGNNYPSSVFGYCISSYVITQFLTDLGIKFYQIEDEKEVIYNENSTKAVIPEPLLPTVFIEGNNEGSIHVKQIKMGIGDQIIVDYNEPFQVAIGRMDKSSNKSSSALVQFAVDGQNEIFITEENAGNVSYLEKNNNYQLEVIKKEIKSLKWKVKASVKTQSYFPFFYFDILIIRRNVDRNHVKDPHLAFFPDASGKYIRYDDEKSIKILTKKTIKGKDSSIIPLHSKVEADEFEIDIIYTVKENTLSISNLFLVDKTI
jgi:hypothetical protein